MQLDHDTLKTRQREIRDGFNESLGLRVHRALSWLNRAEQESKDDDARFIFLWVAFNAAYATNIDSTTHFSEKSQFSQFLKRLVDSDGEKLISKLVWEKFSSSIRLLMDNQHIFQPYWDHINGDLTDAEWRSKFDESKARAHKALSRSDIIGVLKVMFDRLYVLRNQLIHGAATWNSQVNRKQVRDGADIMGHLVPVIIHIMMEHGAEVWGEAYYPVVD